MILKNFMLFLFFGQKLIHAFSNFCDIPVQSRVKVGGL